VPTIFAIIGMLRLRLILPRHNPLDPIMLGSLRQREVGRVG
jgi:hypothetical protein